MRAESNPVVWKKRRKRSSDVKDGSVRQVKQRVDSGPACVVRAKTLVVSRTVKNTPQTVCPPVPFELLL